jgi:hypothetical protein
LPVPTVSGRRDELFASGRPQARHERDLLAPTTREWLDRLAQDEPGSNLSSEETVERGVSSGDIEAKRKAVSYETSGRDVDIETMLAETGFRSWARSG